MNEVSVRPAAPCDGTLILSFIRQLAEYERLSHVVDATEAMMSRALFGPAPRVCCDIAEIDGEPAGFALWFYNFSSFRGRHGIYIEDLFVRPEARGKGVGKRLLAHLAWRCVREGLGRLEWSVLDWNEPSLVFYRAQGADVLDDWKLCRMTGSALRRLADQPG